MAVTENKIPLVGTDSLKLDTTRVTQTDSTVVEREAMVIADAELLANRVNVFESRFTDGDYALNMNSEQIDVLLATMGGVLSELRVIRATLQDAFDNEGIE